VKIRKSKKELEVNGGGVNENNGEKSE